MRLIRRSNVYSKNWKKNIVFIFVLSLLKIVDAAVIILSLGTLIGEFEIEYLISRGTKWQTK